ncbi:hypothetical protein AVEN_216729-1 [Araneus ventricosus]|uniref:Uncharacterized protein n=1 Tax=Araneus ventricosus TaxID=182803 RepID=A0A4Y2U600_ARAVE|nr:hypothetical protein AVEN_216729-1 [Araneus ventricosus]
MIGAEGGAKNSYYDPNATYPCYAPASAAFRYATAEVAWVNFAFCFEISWQWFRSLLGLGIFTDFKKGRLTKFPLQSPILEGQKPQFRSLTSLRPKPEAFCSSFF